MKKLVLCLSMYLITAMSFKTVKADEPMPAIPATTTVDQYIGNIYKQINFKY